MRCALLGPTPGSRPSSSMRSWTAPSYMGHSLGAASDVPTQPFGVAALSLWHEWESDPVTGWEPIADALMTQRYGRLLARARMLTVSEAEAEDLVHDALVATFSKPRGLTTVAQAEQYVRRAIVTVFANDAQRGSRERARVAAVAPDVRVPDH